MRPKSGLIDGAGWVNGTDLEQSHDAVDAGKAGKFSQGKDPVQGDSILPDAMESADHRNRESEYHKVHCDVESLVDGEEKFDIETVAFETLVPASS